MRLPYLLFVCVWKHLDMADSTDVPVLNISGNETYAYNTTIPNTSQKTTNTCRLVPALVNAAETIAGLTGSGKHLVKITVTLKGENGTDVKNGTRLRKWVISTSVTGLSMLMLKEYFDAMSLYTLGLVVDSYSMTLNQEPRDCLKGKQFEEIESIVRRSFLDNFGSADHSLPSGAEICNRNIGEKEANRERLIYECCKYDQENQLECSELTRSIWIELLFVSIIILQVLIILFSPIYMPGFMYKAKSIFQKYVFLTEPDKRFQLKVKVVDLADSTEIDAGFSKAELQDFTSLEKFKIQLDKLTLNEVHTLMIEGVDMCVSDGKIIPEGDAPVSVLTFARDFFVKCKLRYDVTSVRDCCNQDMWVKLPCCKVVFRWYQCLSGIMMLLSAVVLLSPWLLRIWFYYSIEEGIIKHQKEIYDIYGLKLPYSGSLVTYFSPVHPFFNVIHILFAVEILSYIILPSVLKNKVKFTVRKCFRDTRDKSKLEACGSMASYMLRPLKAYGIVGCLLLPLWLIILPLYFVAIALEVVPIANLSVRLLVNLVYYVSKVINPNILKRKDEQVPGKFSLWMKKRFKTIIVLNKNEANTRLNKLLHTLALIMTFITIWLFLLLVAECIAFFVECAVYALIGFILSPRSILKYVSLILLIAVYGNECFGGVHARYAAYNTGISGEVQGMIGDKLTEQASKSKKEQENMAMLIPPKNDIDCPETLSLVIASDGYLKWKADRLAMFLDNSDIPYIPKSFLFKMGHLNHFQCPGLVHLLYLKAMLDFSLIILFLIFVFIVIFAFGQAEDISSAGQAIAALATGFFPLIMRKFLFRSHTYTLDSSNLNWKTMFANAVQTYSEKWNFEDIIVAEDGEIKLDAIDATLESNATVTEINENDIPKAEPFTDLDDVSESLEDNKNKEPVCGYFNQSADLIAGRSLNLDGEVTYTFYVPPNCFDRDACSLYTNDTLL